MPRIARTYLFTHGIESRINLPPSIGRGYFQWWGLSGVFTKHRHDLDRPFVPRSGVALRPGEITARQTPMAPANHTPRGAPSATAMSMTAPLLLVILTATTEIYTLSLHDAPPAGSPGVRDFGVNIPFQP